MVKRTTFIGVRLSHESVVMLNKLIEDGFAPNRSEALRKLLHMPQMKEEHERLMRKFYELRKRHEGFQMELEDFKREFKRERETTAQMAIHQLEFENQMSEQQKEARRKGLARLSN